MPLFSIISIGTTPTQIIAQNGARLAYTIINLGTATVYIWHDNTVNATTHGFQLQSGQSFSGEDDPQDEIWGIVASGTENVYLSEIRPF